MIAHFHLPGLFEFFDFYKVFIPLYRRHPEWFYDWCDIGSVYGAPADCLWGGGRTGFGENGIGKEVMEFFKEYEISARLTFSNSLLEEKHLNDKKCNELCRIFENPEGKTKNGIIIYSDLLLNYLKSKYPDFYYISSTTKCLTEFSDLEKELERPEFSYVVPDFSLNKDFENLSVLPQDFKNKVEFLVNECCQVKCPQRKSCYENVSRKSLGLECEEHKCLAPGSSHGYRFTRAMESPAFISVEDIEKKYLPKGFSNFKIEGRSLGSALILEILLYYMVTPQTQLKVRERVYLDNTLDLF